MSCTASEPEEQQTRSPAFLPFIPKEDHPSLSSEAQDNFDSNNIVINTESTIKYYFRLRLKNIRTVFNVNFAITNGCSFLINSSRLLQE